MTPQIWVITIPDPVRGPERARRLEEEGYDGLLVVDSQCMAPDSFVGLTTMAAATERIGIGTGVSNPATRHPSVLAGAAASLNVVSGGRVVLGIGRGDSSLFHIGRDPAPLSEFEPYLTQLCAYARGEAVDIGGTESRLRWLPYWNAAPVPVDVACTGPRITRFAACVADRITFAVGCDPERLRWSIDLARTARTDAGLVLGPALDPPVGCASCPSAARNRSETPFVNPELVFAVRLLVVERGFGWRRGWLRCR